MKKILAILLVMMLALISVAAYAADETTPASQFTPSVATTTTIPKKYALQGTNAVNPTDTLTFTAEAFSVTKSSTITTTAQMPAVTIGTNADGKVSITSGTNEYSIQVNIPSFTSVGEYVYKITETDANVAGVTLSDPVYLKIQVIQTNGALSIGSYTWRKAAQDGTVDTTVTTNKITQIDNKYDAGSLKVSKEVTGNMGDYDKEWTFTVTFTAPEGKEVVGNITATAEGATAPSAVAGGWTTTATSTFKLKHGQSVQFNNIPVDVTYSVTEAEANADEYTTTPDGDTGTIAAATVSEAKFENKKEIAIDTGIELETLPYVLIMAVVMVGIALMVARRRKEQF